jgi:hypothetical protein
MGVLDEPFPGTWALEANLLTRWELRHNFTRVFPDVYVRKGIELDARTRAAAAAHWAKGDGVLVGFSAAALHGTRWIEPTHPAELIRGGHTRTPPGIVGRQDRIRSDELCTVDGFVVSNPARTAFDLGRRLDDEAAVIMIDALCNVTNLHPKQVLELADRYPGARGIRRLHRTLGRVDVGAESPQETRTRLVIVDDGLPPPTTQLRIRDEFGRVIARADMGWEQWKVIVEYDGAQHWTDEEQRTWDIERRFHLKRLGWQVVHVNSEQLRTRPWIVAERVRDALRAAGAPV